jgi:hypothetical protein
MKQKFFLAFITIALSVFSATAQSQEHLIVNAGNVEHINIANDMNIVLLPGAETDRSISLDANAASKLDLGVSNNSLTISALRSSSRKEKLTVYLYVNNLKSITVERNTVVKTMGVLNTQQLDLFVDGESTVHLKTKGYVKAYALNDAEVKVRYISQNPLARRPDLSKK